MPYPPLFTPSYLYNTCFFPFEMRRSGITGAFCLLCGSRAVLPPCRLPRLFTLGGSARLRPRPCGPHMLVRALGIPPLYFLLCPMYYLYIYLLDLGGEGVVAILAKANCRYTSVILNGVIFWCCLKVQTVTATPVVLRWRIPFCLFAPLKTRLLCCSCISHVMVHCL